MYANNTRSGGRQVPRLKRKNILPGGYSFLKEKFPTREKDLGLTEEMVERLRAELQSQTTKILPECSSFSSLNEAVRTYYKTFKDENSTILKIVVRDGCLHFKQFKAIFDADDFRAVPIAFAYKLEEPFGTLARRALHSIFDCLGLTDIRMTYYFEMMSECYEDELYAYEQARLTADTDEDEEGNEERKNLHEKIKSYDNGPIGQHLTEFSKLPPADFEELRRYTPKPDEKPLYDCLLKAEEVFKDTEPLTEHSLGRCLAETSEDGYPEDIVCLQQVLVYYYSPDDDDILDEYDVYINGDLDSGYCLDSVGLEKDFGNDGPDAEEKDLRENFQRMHDYFWDLISVINHYG